MPTLSTKGSSHDVPHRGTLEDPDQLVLLDLPDGVADLDSGYGENEECVLDADDLRTLKLNRIEFTTPREDVLNYIESHQDLDF